MHISKAHNKCTYQKHIIKSTYQKHIKKHIKTHISANRIDYEHRVRCLAIDSSRIAIESEVNCLNVHGKGNFSTPRQSRNVA